MTQSTWPRPRAKGTEPSTDAPHDENRKRRVAQTRVELMEQGEALARSLEAEGALLRELAQSLRTRPLDRVCFVGCGDSWLVGIGVRALFERVLGLPCEAVQALDYALYYASTANPRTLVLGISSSGNTPAVMQALQAARARGAFAVGVSNTEQRPLLREFDAGLLVRARRAGWPTQASTSAMALLDLLALELAEARGAAEASTLQSLRAGLAALPEQMRTVLARQDEPTEQLAAELVEARWVFFTGAGPHLAPAGFGAAKVKELCPIHASAFPLEEFHHYRSLKPGDPLFLVAPDAASHSRALDTAEVGRYDGGQVLALVPEGEREIAETARWAAHLPPLPDLLAPLLYSLPLHLLAYHLAAQKFERGLGYPGAFPDRSSPGLATRA